MSARTLAKLERITAHAAVTMAGFTVTALALYTAIGGWNA